MFINNVSFSAIKQTASDKAHQVGCFCGRKIEVLKANTSSLLSVIQSYASKAFKKLSETVVLAKKTLVATKDYIVAKVSELAARVFKKKTTPADETKEGPTVQAEIAGQAAPVVAAEAPAPVVAAEAPAPVVAAEAPAQANSTRRSPRNRKPTDFFTPPSSKVRKKARRP